MEGLYSYDLIRSPSARYVPSEASRILGMYSPGVTPSRDMQSGRPRGMPGLGVERWLGSGIGIVVVADTFAEVGAVVALGSAALVPWLGTAVVGCFSVACYGGGGRKLSIPQSQLPRHLQLHHLL